MSIQQEKFKAIADKIREKTNKTDVIKPNDFVNKIDEVYNAGGLDYSPKETVSGEVISITDISPIEHDLGVKVSSKNLIPNTYKSVSNETVSYIVNEDGTITISNVGNNALTTLNLVGKDFDQLLIDGATYTFAINAEGDNSNALLYLYAKDKITNEGKWFLGAKDLETRKLIVDKSKYEYVKLYIQLKANVEAFENAVVKPIMALGSYTNLPYTPFVKDVSTTTLKAQGKNLFNNDTSLIKQVTYYSTSGTEYQRYGYEILLPVGTYTINAFSKVPLDDTHLYYMYGHVVDENDVVTGKTATIVVNSTPTAKTFTIESGEKLLMYDGETSNLAAAKKLFSRFDVQLEVGESATEYEPYIESTTYTPNSDGTVDNVKSIYPSVTLSTDTNGVLIECEYYQDAIKLKQNLTDAILSLGGTLNV